MLSVLTMNVGAPSTDRARRQLAWLHQRPEDIFVLTETKATAGTTLLAQAFTAAGYSVTLPDHPARELGVMIVSKLPASPDPLAAAIDFLPARVAAIQVDTIQGPLRVAGTYVPSRDAGAEKTARKARFLAGLDTALAATASTTPLLLLGDLNVIEPGHVPAHTRQFADFEYNFFTGLTDRHGLVDLWRRHNPDRVEHSWARREDLGYRYDHAHASHALLDLVHGCDYLHQTRQPGPGGQRLTDHSALTAALQLDPTVRLSTTDPTHTAAADPEPALF